MPHSQYRFLKTANISSSLLIDETVIEFCKMSTKAVKPCDGSILVAKDGGGQGLGECCIYESRPGVIDYISDGILCLEFENDADRNYVFGILKSRHFKEYIDSATPGGSTLRHSKLLTLDYPIPWSEDTEKRQTISELVGRLLDNERTKKAMFRDTINDMVNDIILCG